MTTPRVGQKQHVDMWRKVRLRRRVLTELEDAGAAYVPFIGDGDIAVALYADRMVYGADIDPDRIAIVESRLPTANLLTADCNGWPFAGIDLEPVAVGDFDAYSYPYASFRSFWESGAPRAGRMAVFFTDSQRQTVSRNGLWRTFDNDTMVAESSTNARRKVFNFYLNRHVLPRFESYIKPWRIGTVRQYVRGGTIYWGTIITAPDGGEHGISV